MKSSFLPSYVLGFLIFVVASWPGSDLAKIQESPDNPFTRFLLSDPFMHFLCFGVLTFLICFGYSHYEHRPKSIVNKSKSFVESSAAPSISYFKVGNDWNRVWSVY